MKKVKLLLISILSASLIFSTTAYAYNPATDVHYERIAGSNLFVEDPGNMSQSDQDMYNYVLSVTPAATLELFTQQDVRVYLTHSVSTEARSLGNGSRFDGVTYTASIAYNNATKEVVKINSPVAIYIYSNTSRPSAYIHECGHALDLMAEYITGYYVGSKPISNSPEWQSLYATYAPVLATFDNDAPNNVYSAAEAFAEAYRFYYDYPDQMLAKCPEVYNYVDGQIAKYQAYVAPLTYENFDYEYYANTYPDLLAAFGYDRDALWNHYNTFGKAEGRKVRRK